jgi:predicted SAM-dependent methyltransferase
MIKVKTYKGTDELIDAVRETQKEAFNAMKEWHAALKPGDKVLVLFPEFPIFQELVEEDEEDKERSKKLPQYMLVRAYSVVCPEGELGSACRCNAAVQLTEEEWEAFCEDDWNLLEETWRKYGASITERIRKNAEEDR